MPLQKIQVPIIDAARCSGCGRCVAACPERLFSLETFNHRKYAIISEPKRCTGCKKCIEACPLSVILLFNCPDFPEYKERTDDQSGIA